MFVGRDECPCVSQSVSATVSGECPCVCQCDCGECMHPAAEHDDRPKHNKRRVPTDLSRVALDR